MSSEDFTVFPISSDEDEGDTQKPQNASLWLGEPKKWQQITAADFEEVRELSDTDDEIDTTDLVVSDTKFWSQSIVPTKYYVRNSTGGLVGTTALHSLQKEFEENILDQIVKIRDAQVRSDPPKAPEFHACSSCNHEEKEETESSSENDCDDESDSSSSTVSNSGSNSSNSCSSNNSVHSKRKPQKQKTKKLKNDSERKPTKHYHEAKPNKQSLMAKQAIERKQNHPAGLHPDVCFNEPGQVNDGPFCKCSWAAKQTGVRHNKFAGEYPIPKCDLNDSNIGRLHHYVLKVTPNPNKFTRGPSHINVDGIDYIFDGFSVFFHQPLPETFPQSPMNQWNYDFVVKFQKENPPESFTIKDLELFHTYLFDHIMEMYDLDRTPNAKGDSCLFYHCMPRFVRLLKDDGKEILPMSSVIKHFVDCFVPFIDDAVAINYCKEPKSLLDMVQKRKGQLFINPAKKPMCIRVDLIDNYDLDPGHNDFYPLFTHFGIRPSAYTYSGKPEYQRALKRFIKLRHLLSLKSRLNSDDRQMLRDSEEKLKRLRSECKTKRDISICVSSRGFYETGLYPDIVQHGMFLILACSHIRFHWSLKVYEEERIKYKFKNRILLELALTHPSYRSNYGTNSDHAKNTLNNCGIIQTKVRGAKAEPNPATEMKSSRKRGITALMEIMSMQGSKKAVKISSVNHNERLEFLGDAVVEFITTVHLFFMFPKADEGVLATYRSALVQNKHLASLAKKIGLYEFMLYAHGPDLCHEADLRHAMANAFEALMAAIFLDSNINECDRIFSDTLYGDDEELWKIWANLPDHELKVGNPFGDRHKIEEIACLKNLTDFEEQIGIHFKYIRVLAKALTRRNIDFNYLTFGHNQRLEFLGDTVLQLITTDYLYKHFPNHQEGHLSLLRTCLVSNKTQSVICDDLAMQRYLIVTKKAERSGKLNTQLRLKDKADLVESFLGALYVDRGLQYCTIFCRVCFFPRLKYFILTQRWNDPKSQLQQCCLTLRQAESGEPDIPEYKTIGVEGPTNTRVYRVAVYFRNKRLAEGVGSSVQLAQMQAAENALIEKAELFPSFDFRNTYLGVRNCDQKDEPTVPASSKSRRRKRMNSNFNKNLGPVDKKSRTFHGTSRHNSHENEERNVRPFNGSVETSTRCSANGQDNISPSFTKYPAKKNLQSGKFSSDYRNHAVSTSSSLFNGSPYEKKAFPSYDGDNNANKSSRYFASGSSIRPSSSKFYTRHSSSSSSSITEPGTLNPMFCSSSSSGNKNYGFFNQNLAAGYPFGNSTSATLQVQKQTFQQQSQRASVARHSYSQRNYSHNAVQNFSSQHTALLQRGPDNSNGFRHDEASFPNPGSHPFNNATNGRSEPKKISKYEW